MRKKITLFVITACVSLALQAQIVITGVMYDPVGADAPAVGTTADFPAGAPSKGGFEYFQLMATEDIDFSKTPYSLVKCANSTGNAVTANNWAEGGARTFKFNLTEGTAAKGTFFYVGGDEKCIAGFAKALADEHKRSADISHANWIRTIAYSAGVAAGVVVGDGFGDSSTGLMPNSGHPFGIAVFTGTEVTNVSEPIDVIFYTSHTPITGTALTQVYNASQGWGYKITNTDYYKKEDEFGNPQPFYGQGTNTFGYIHQDAAANKTIFTADRANFMMLGGEYNCDTKTWDEPRTSSHKTLWAVTTQPCTATLADIETGDGVTKAIFSGASISNQTLEKQTLLKKTLITNQQLELKNGSAIAAIEVVSLAGKTLLSITKPNSIVNLANIPAGVYAVRISTDKGVAVEKISVK